MFTRLVGGVLLLPDDSDADVDEEEKAEERGHDLFDISWLLLTEAGPVSLFFLLLLELLGFGISVSGVLS